MEDIFYLVNLGYEYPILFLPIRLETKYSKKIVNGVTSYSLRIRFFPDDLSIDNFDPRLTQGEFQDAVNYWKKIISFSKTDQTKFDEQRNMAWQLLVERYGCPRSAHITKAVIVYNPLTDPDPINPAFRLTKDIKIRKEGEYNYGEYKVFPTSFIVYGRFKDTTLDPVTFQGKPILSTSKDTNSIFLNPFLISTQSTASNVKTVSDWLTNFKTAVEIGMAVEIPLNERQYKSGFEILVAYGVRDNVTPLQTKVLLEDLFKSHRYTKGFRLLKQGTPTNLVKSSSPSSDNLSTSGEFYSSDENQLNPQLYRSIEFSRLSPDTYGTSIINISPDGKIFDKALGIEAANGIYNSNNFEQTFWRMMSLALGPAVLGYFISRFLSLSSISVDNRNTDTNILQHFVKYVNGQGSIPSFRVGNIPYGILPITILTDWRDTLVFPNKNFLGVFLEFLRKRWLSEFTKDVPTIMNSNVPNGGSTVSSPDKLLLDILSKEALSHSYYERLIRSLSFIRYFISNEKKLPISNEDLYGKYVQSFNELLKKTFPSIQDTKQEIGIIKNLYDMVPSEIAEQLSYPMVSFNPNEKFDDTALRNYIKVMYDDIDLKKNKSEFINFSSTSNNKVNGYIFRNTDPLLFKLLRYSARYLGKYGDTAKIDDFKNSLSFLSENDPDTDTNNLLQNSMIQTLDVVSYRLDAWISSLANQRLDYLRSKNKDGIYIGSFGWIENLIPKDISLSIKPVYEGGYVHAPSYAHAVAASVLRNGYLTFANDSEKKDLLNVNLDSERTKNALDIIEGIQHMTLNELLGYRFERRLHDYSIEYLIDEFRNTFPLKINSSSSDGDNVSNKESVQPRNLCDGYLIYKNWKRLFTDIQKNTFDRRTEDKENELILNFMKNPSDPDEIWKKFYDKLANRFDVLDIIKDIKPHLNYLLDLIDCLSDLCLAESIYQAVQGKYERSAAVLDGLGGDGKIPFPEIATTPRNSIFQLQRIVLLIEAENPRPLDLKKVGVMQWINPRVLAESNLNGLLASYFEGVTFWIDFIEDKTNKIVSTIAVGLKDLMIQPADLLYISKNELEQRILFYGKSINRTKSFIIRYNKGLSSSHPTSINNVKSMPDLQFLLNPLKELFSQGQPLRLEDFISSSSAASSPSANLSQNLKNNSEKNMKKEIFQRYYDLLVLVAQTINDLQNARDAKIDTKTNNIEKILNMKKEILMRASLFGIDFAIPIDREGNVIKDLQDLNKKIDLTIAELVSRVKSDLFEDYLTALTEWKNKWESLRRNNDSFFSFISSQIGAQDLETFVSVFVRGMRNIIKDDSFLILPPFYNPQDSINRFSIGETLKPKLNKTIRKWIQKASYVRPKLKLFDNIVTVNQIYKSAYFTYYCDGNKFNQTAESLANISNNDNITSTIVAVCTKSNSPEKIFPPKVISHQLTGLVIDEWVEKINLPTQDTAITFDYDTPNSEAPQSILLAVSPNDQHKWTDTAIRDVILETFDLAKIRSVDYRSIKDLRQILPLVTLNTMGDDVRMQRTAWIRSLYFDLLGRTPSQAEIDNKLYNIETGVTVENMADIFIKSQEYCQGLAHWLYRHFLDRDPEPGAKEPLGNSLATNLKLQNAILNFCDSPEFKVHHPVPNEFIKHLYIKILDRQPDTGGFQYYVNLLNSGRSTTDAINSFLLSREYASQRSMEYYRKFLQRESEGEPSGHARAIQQGTPLQQIIKGFVTSDEYRNKAIERTFPIR